MNCSRQFKNKKNKMAGCEPLTPHLKQRKTTTSQQPCRDLSNNYKLCEL